MLAAAQQAGQLVRFGMGASTSTSSGTGRQAEPRLRGLSGQVARVAAGVPRGLVTASWLGLTAPEGKPDGMVRKPAAQVPQALRSPDIVATLASVGSVGHRGTPEQMQKMLEDEIGRWRGLINKAGTVV